MVFIVDDAVADAACEQTIKEFDAKVLSFYPPEDRKRGYIKAKDRQGKEQKFGLLAISIGIVSNAHQPIAHVAQISEIGAELKKYAKSFEKSIYVRDKRSIK